MLHEDLTRFFDGFPRDAHPMPVLSSARVGAVDLLPGLARPVRPRPGRDLDHPAAGQAARRSPPTPTRSRSASRYLYPDNSLDLVENFLRMTFGVPAEPYEVDPVVVEGAEPAADAARRPRAELLDLDGAPGRLVARQPVRLGVAPASTPCSGPLHGGANQAVLEMLEEIQADGGDVNTFVRQVKDRKDGVQAHGLRPSRLQELRPARGDHQEDGPRGLRAARRSRPAARHRAATRGGRAVATSTSSSASSTRTSTSTRASSTRRMGFPTEMFTVLFAIGRLPGLDRPLARDDRQTRPPRSVGRGRCTSASPCATTRRSPAADSPPSLPESGRIGAGMVGSGRD